MHRTQDPGSRIPDPGYSIYNCGSSILDRYWLDPGSRVLNPGSWTMNLNSLLNFCFMSEG